MEWVKKGKYTLADAIKAAMVHEETRALYFTAHVTMNAAGKGQGDENPTKWQKNKGKAKNEAKSGKGETKNKGSSKGGMNITSTTPDNCMICFKWNDGKECDGSCGMLHVCRVVDCHDPSHPMVAHPGFDNGKKFKQL